MNRNEIIERVIAREGGYANDPEDLGGETNFGITALVARANGYTGVMRDMSREAAVRIYTARYWAPLCADTVLEMSRSVAEELFDTAVNMGVQRAAMMLQRALNVLNDRERLYPALAVDGRIGPATLRALSEYLAARDELVLCRALNCLQGALYIELAESRERNERFVYGWLKNRVVL